MGSYACTATHKKSAITLHTIYDHIQQCGGVLNLSLDQNIGNAAQNASLVYRAERRNLAEMEKKAEKS